MSGPNHQPKKTEEKPPVDFKNLFNPLSARDLVAYVLLALGIILLFVEALYGGLLIGVVAGAYFSKDLLYIVRNFETFINTQGAVRTIILAGLTLAFLISAPAIFVGILLVLAINLFLSEEKS